MCVAKDTDVGVFSIQKASPFACELPAFIHDVTDGDAEAGQFDDRLWWKSTLLKPIDIAGDGRHGSKKLKLLDDESCADITGMNNVIDASEVSYDRRIKQAVGVGNNADANRA